MRGAARRESNLQKEQKYSSNDVRNERLRPRSNGETRDAGGGEQGPNVEPEFTEHHDGTDRPDGVPRRRLEQFAKRNGTPSFRIRGGEVFDRRDPLVLVRAPPDEEETESGEAEEAPPAEEECPQTRRFEPRLRGAEL